MKKIKIVLRVAMNDEKKRSVALKIAAGLLGVLSVAVEGDERDRIVVVGEGIDPAALTCKLRKQIRCTELVSVVPMEEAKPPPPAPAPAPAQAPAPPKPKEKKPPEDLGAKFVPAEVCQRPGPCPRCMGPVYLCECRDSCDEPLCRIM